MSINAIYLRRAQKVILPKGTTGLADISLIATAMKNIENLGYTFSKEVIVDLITSDNADVVLFVNAVTDTLKALLGDNVRHRPMYPNFPNQVMNAPEAELYVNAMLHYLGSAIGLTILPVYEKANRPELTHTQPLTIIEKGSEVDFQKMILNLATSKVSFNDVDRADLKTVLETSIRFGGEIPNKENLAYIATLDESFTSQFKTATDVLRYAVALSDGDISLATKTKFKKFRKAQRRQILGLLNDLNGVIVEDMLRNKSEWKRLGEILHPGEYASRFPKAAEAFNVLRNDLPFETFNAKTERLLKEGLTVEAASHLLARPGEFARRLDQLLRASKGSAQVLILGLFNDHAAEVSSTVLLQTRAHFLNRDAEGLRVFFPKGNIAKFTAVEENRQYIEPVICNEVVNITTRALAKIYGEGESLGRVFIDPTLKGYLIPFSNRSASAGVKTLARGTRMALPDTPVVRFFTHWKDLDKDPEVKDPYSYNSYRRTVDIDLSAGLLDADFKTRGQVAYYNLRELGGVHSGDITSAPNGASEFIDINIDQAVKAGHRYVYMSILSYSRQSFKEIPELFAGFMGRENAGSGEVYEPKTVLNKVDITLDGTNCIPLIIDLVEREVIWTDMSMPSTRYRPNNIASNKSGLELLSEAMVTRKAPTLFDLFTIHAESRGALVDTREDADVVFALDGDITPFDTELILSEYV